jgi:uncharacterized protein with FMN-binding domain
VRRAILALLGTAAGTALLVGVKGGFSHPSKPPVPRADNKPSPSKVVPKPLRNGTWKGDAKVNEFGTVQLSIVVSAGKITTVKVLAYPKDRAQSAEINNTALPKLRSRALAAQSSDIDTVTGATVTSEGYRQSLQAAIDRARG